MPPPQDLPGPFAAVVQLRELPPRFGALFARSNPEALLRRLPAAPSAWSALECTAHVGDVLAAANDRLRQLIGDDIHPHPRLETPRTGGGERGCGAVLESLTARANRLARTIHAATALDWERARTSDGTTAPELVGRALHDARRHLHDLEAALDRVPAL